jgi:uncharacterized membrane protein YdjX (TVP38/TMEM64 family)
LALLGLVGLVYASGVHRHVDVATLDAHRDTLTAFVGAHPVPAALLYILVYAAATAVSVPGAAVLTITGGFLFGTVVGAGLAVLGATAGAVAIFLVARTSLGEPLRARAGPWLERMRRGFQENAFSYLLVLRLIPLFPFWLVNVVPALLGMGLGAYALATLIGIVPGSLVFASLGNGLGALLDAGEEPDLGIVFDPQILLPLLGLALLALLPVAYRRWRGNGRRESMQAG